MLQNILRKNSRFKVAIRFDVDYQSNNDKDQPCPSASFRLYSCTENKHLYLNKQEASY